MELFKLLAVFYFFFGLLPIAAIYAVKKIVDDSVKPGFKW